MDEKKRILVVDDDSDSLEFAAATLTREGYEVITATDGKEGLAKAIDQHPDLVILDVVMPEQDGWDTCDQLREIKELQKVPVVYLTCVEGPGTLYTDHGLYETVWDEYLRKPVVAKDLVRVVGRLLQRQAAAR
jgi:two-component system alkaline phosphatase synthesis response regulator PhoP